MNGNSFLVFLLCVRLVLVCVGSWFMELSKVLTLWTLYIICTQIYYYYDGAVKITIQILTFN